MNNKIRHIFIFIFVFSVFSLTLQASVVQICKDSKVFKNQSQQSPVTEEEEEKSHDSDENVDEDDLLCNNCGVNNEIHLFKRVSICIQPDDDIASSALKILIPPPKILI